MDDCITRAVIKIIAFRIANALISIVCLFHCFRKSFETPTEGGVDEYDVVRAVHTKLPNGQLGKILADKV